MTALPIHLCRVETPEGFKDYVTLVSPEVSFKQGLAPEAILGVLSRPVDAGQPISPAVFAGNPVFVQFLHDVIARHAPTEPSCQSHARQQGTGWLYIIDQRTATPDGDVPAEDIVGGLEVKQGEVVAGSYRPNPNHRILSERGFFQVSPFLQACLLKEISARQGRVLPRR
jgi:hypothetical protein